MISIEPLKEPYRKLAVLASRDDSWTAIRSAAGARAGSMDIHVAANGGASSSFLPMLELVTRVAPEARYVAEEQVAVATLDALIKPFIREAATVFVKADVHGFELEVLAGGTATLAQSSLVQLEMSLVPLYDRAPTASNVLTFMAERGFGLVGVDPGMAAPSGLLLQVDGMFTSDDLAERFEWTER